MQHTNYESQLHCYDYVMCYVMYATVTRFAAEESAEGEVDELELELLHGEAMVDAISHY